MAQTTFATEVTLAKMALRALRNNSVALNLFNRQFKNDFNYEKGAVVNVKKPMKFIASDGTKRQSQPVRQETTPIKVDTQKHVSWSTNQIDMTLSANPKRLYEEIVEPAMIAITTAVDVDLLTMALDVHNAVGTAGSTPSTYLVIGQVAQRLSDQSVPQKKRKIIIDTAAQVTLADALSKSTGVNNPDMIKDFMKSMYLGGLAEMDFYVSQNLPRLTVGVPGGTPRVNGANQTGTSLVIDGMTATTGTYKKGDIITIADVNDVNPVNHNDLNYVKKFVITEDATADGSGNATLSISPAIITSGAYQTCTASPANDALITQVTSSNCMNNLAFYPDAFTYVTVPIKLPDMEGVGKTVSAEGLTCTVTKGWDIDNYEMVYRIDILYGKKTMLADQACRLLG